MAVEKPLALFESHLLGKLATHPSARPTLASLPVVAGADPAGSSRHASPPRSRTLGPVQGPD
jgi:hypothetical protein